MINDDISFSKWLLGMNWEGAYKTDSLDGWNGLVRFVSKKAAVQGGREGIDQQGGWIKREV
jgi:hypothetical protein